MSNLASSVRSIKTSSEFAVPLRVISDEGALVTATNGSLELSAPVEDGIASMILTSSGTWTITAALNGNSKSKTLEVTGYEVSLKGLNSRLPEGYQEVEYIQSSGTQFIDTGIKPSANIKTVIDLDRSIDVVGQQIILWSALKSGSSTWYRYVFSSAYSSSSLSYYVMVGTTTTSWYLLNGSESQGGKIGRVTAVIDIPQKLVYIEGLGRTTSITTNPTFSTSMPNLSILGSSATGTGGFVGKLYLCKLYSSNSLVRDLVPCIQESTNKVGLYDLVTNKFYENQGTGDLIAGS